jgi:hypothetical protein
MVRVRLCLALSLALRQRVCFACSVRGFAVLTAATQAIGNGSLSSDRFVVPFTYAGHQTTAVSAALPSDATYFLAVRACYPAGGGCFDPVVSAPVVVEAQAPEAGAMAASVAEREGAVTVAANWSHWTEVSGVIGRCGAVCWRCACLVDVAKMGHGGVSLR